MQEKFCAKTCYHLYHQGDDDARPYLLLIHGLGMHQEMWQWQIPILSQYYRLVTYDFFDHGKSGSGDDLPSLNQFSAQILELLECLNIEKCTLIGFSIGGMIARHFAMNYAPMLNGLVILNSPYLRTTEQQQKIASRVTQVEKDGPSATVEAAMERWFTENFRTSNPEIIQQVTQWVLSNKDPKKYANNYRVLVDGIFEICPLPKPITCPTLVLTGDEDFGNNPEMSRQITAEIEDAELVILPKLRHMALVENPDLMNQTLLSFLTKIHKRSDNS